MRCNIHDKHITIACIAEEETRGTAGLYVEGELLTTEEVIEFVTRTVVTIIIMVTLTEY